MPDVVIVGGGIAGLAASWELTKRGIRTVVLEAQSRAGGVIRTEHVNGFVIDAGPDALLVHKPAALTLCRELGLGDRLFPTLTPRTAYVLRGRRLVPLPEASVLGIPTKVAPFVTTALFSLKGKARMAMELVIPPRKETTDESIGSFMRRRFGDEAVTYLAEPLLAGIHAGDVNRLSMTASFPRLQEAERTRGSVLRALSSPAPAAAQSATAARSSGAFMSLPGGIEEMVVTLVRQLPSDTVRLASAVRTIEGRDPYRVYLDSGPAIEARSVIVAAPAWAAAPMLTAINRDLAALIAQVRYVSSATVAVGLKREQVRHPLNGSGFVVPRPERRALMAASWVSSKWPQRAPEGSVLLRGFVGGAYDQAILERRDDTIIDDVFHELADLLGITGTPQLTRIYRWNRANPQHEVGHLERMAEIDRLLAAHPGLFVTGSGFRGTGIPDCVADGRAVADEAAAFVGKIA